MYCIKCGKEISENANFCCGCGYKIEVNTTVPQESGKQSAVTAKKSNKVAVFGLAAVLVVGAVVGIGSLVSSNNGKSSDSNSKSSQVISKKISKFDLKDHIGNYYLYDFSISESIEKIYNDGGQYVAFTDKYLSTFIPQLIFKMNDEKFFDFHKSNTAEIISPFDASDFESKEKDGGMYYYSIKNQIAFLFKDDSIEVYMPDVTDADYLKKAIEKTVDDSGVEHLSKIFLTDNPDQFFRRATYIKVPDSYKGSPDMFEWDDSAGNHWSFSFDVL